MPKKLQFIIFVGLAALTYGTARAEVTACNLVQKADVERITGLKVSEPTSERLNQCAGLCESLDGWRCVYTTLGSGTSGVVVVDMYLPPFEPRNWIGVVRDISGWDGRKPAIDIEVSGVTSLWDFNQNRSVLHIFDDPRRHIVIVQEGADENAAALEKAEALAALITASTR